MSEKLQVSDTTNEPVRRSFRWQILPAAILLTLGLVMTGSSVYCFVMAAYMNATEGWIVVQPTPSFMNRLAFTYKNVSGWIIWLLLGSLAYYCTFLWLRSRWWIAVLATLVWCLLLAWLGDSPHERGSLVMKPSRHATRTV